MDDARGGVLAVEGALRSAKHLHAGHVDEVAREDGGPGKHFAVHHDGRARLQAGGVLRRADAADRQDGGARLVAVGQFEIDPDGEVKHVQNRVSLEFLKRLAPDDAHRHGYVLEHLFALLGRDDHLLKQDAPGAIRLDLLSLERQRHGNHDREDQDDKWSSIHEPPPNL